MKKHNNLSSKKVVDFKSSYCDENRIIINELNTNFKKYFQTPVLDVGCGTGDIAFNVFGDKQAILLDIKSYEDKCHSQSNNHTRVVKDFFKFRSTAQINTVFVSHSLQFLDDNIEDLDKKIHEINPINIILITNNNDDFLGEIIKWLNSNLIGANPEVRINEFPKGYNLIESHGFTATLSCPNFDVLAQQISYLMMVELGSKQHKLIEYLKETIKQPSFTINQTIEIYKKNEQ